MAIYRYIFWLTLFSMLLFLAWLMMPERKPEPVNVLNITEEDISALRAALESEDLEKVVQKLPAKLREEAKIVIQGPNFLGKDKEGMKWNVTAEKAYQERDSTVLGLERVVAKRAEDNPNKKVNLAAPEGQFNDATNTLYITKGYVGLVKDIGVAGRIAEYKMLDQLATGEGFSAKHEDGQMSADSFKANLIAETAEFNGQVRMRIKLKPREEAAKETKSEPATEGDTK